MDKYILVSWPEIQSLMDHPRWDECLLCLETYEEEVEVEIGNISDQTYAVPEDLYYEVYPTAKDKVTSAIERLKLLSEKEEQYCDQEIDHRAADTLLLEIIKELGYPEASEYFSKIEKWYA